MLDAHSRRRGRCRFTCGACPKIRRLCARRFCIVLIIVYAIRACCLPLPDSIIVIYEIRKRRSRYPRMLLDTMTASPYLEQGAARGRESPTLQVVSDHCNFYAYTVCTFSCLYLDYLTAFYSVFSYRFAWREGRTNCSSSDVRPHKSTYQLCDEGCIPHGTYSVRAINSLTTFTQTPPLPRACGVRKNLSWECSTIRNSCLTDIQISTMLKNSIHDASPPSTITPYDSVDLTFIHFPRCIVAAAAAILLVISRRNQLHCSLRS